MRVVALVACALLVSAPTVAAAALVAAPSPTGGEVIVGYRPGGGDDAVALVKTLGGTTLRTNEDLRMLVVSTQDVARFLAAAALATSVEYVEKNDPTHLAGAQWNGAQWNGAQWNGAQWNGAQWNGASSTADPGLDWQWGLRAVRAPAAWNQTIGTRSATLCVLDSGVAWDHPDLAANGWTGADGAHGYNAIDPTKSAYDDAGHGTHVAGVAAAIVHNDLGTAGVGNVRVMPVKVLAANGTGQEDDLAAGIVWCANRGASVALMALSVDDEGPTIKKALEYAAARDVLLVASAGNGACSGCVEYPARAKEVVAVSALGTDGARAPFSSTGQQVDIAAPGVEILAPFLGGGYTYGSGTSQAAAFVAGAAALVRDAHPELSASDARAKLLGGARDIGAAGTDATYGAGALDVAAAVGG